ncbi:hypothetical protein [Burkholderia stabilis]|uniref:hypothetical protein n=1 Tax=Burkholderia stabilis TaxID=95485 RepID=UPI0015914925|nr:hypothetical protein [Burkholderia stabilis]
MMAGFASRARARPVARGRWPGRAAGDAPPVRLPPGLAVAAHLAGVAAGIVAIAVLTTLLALMLR